MPFPGGLRNWITEMEIKMEKENQQYIKMTETKISALISSLAIPTIVSMLITSVYNMADTFFVSKLGASASGAIGIVFSLMAIIQAVGFTLGQGAGSVISRLLGEHKQKEADKIASSGFAASIAFGGDFTGGRTSFLKAAYEAFRFYRDDSSLCMRIWQVYFTGSACYDGILCFK